MIVTKKPMVQLHPLYPYQQFTCDIWAKAQNKKEVWKIVKSKATKSEKKSKLSTE